jgi:hypothetical protein
MDIDQRTSSYSRTILLSTTTSSQRVKTLSVFPSFFLIYIVFVASKPEFGFQLRELRSLVVDAAAGDRFTFLCECGSGLSPPTAFG